MSREGAERDVDLSGQVSPHQERRVWDRQSWFRDLSVETLGGAIGNALGAAIVAVVVIVALWIISDEARALMVVILREVLSLMLAPVSAPLAVWLMLLVAVFYAVAVTRGRLMKQVNALKSEIQAAYQEIVSGSEREEAERTHKTELLQASVKQQEGLESARSEHDALTALLLVLARRLWPPTITIGGYVRKLVAFHVRQERYSNADPNYFGDRPYCGYCEIPLGATPYRTEYSCRTPDCMGGNKAYRRDDVDALRDYSEDLVEALVRKIEGSGKQVRVDSNVEFSSESPDSARGGRKE